MSRAERPSDPERDTESARIDSLLRAGLEPVPGTARRLITTARTHRPEPARRFVPVTAAALVAAALIAFVWLRPARSPVTPGVADLPPRITISNLDGPLTVTVPSGSRWIILDSPGELP